MRIASNRNPTASEGADADVDESLCGGPNANGPSQRAVSLASLRFARTTKSNETSSPLEMVRPTISASLLRRRIATNAKSHRRDLKV